MLREKQKLKNKSRGITLGQSRYKLSSLVFGVVLMVGLVWAGIDALTSKKEEHAALNIDGMPIVIPGWWYSDYFGYSVCEKEECQPDADPDGDKLTNQHEYYYHSDPTNKDTNGNGLTDGEDVAFGYAPDKEGRVSFDQVASDDNIVGESLLFDKEVKDLIVDMSDFSKVVLPEISDSELNIIDSRGVESFVDYMLALDDVSKKYNPTGNEFDSIGEQVKQQNSMVIDDLKLMAVKVREEYRKIPVPRDAIQLHKYHLALWGVLPHVLDFPAQDLGLNVYNTAANKWYDNAQIMISLNQKMEIELQKLRNQYRQ